LVVNYSPRFRAEPMPGAFRAAPVEQPWSAALRDNESGALRTGSETPAPPQAAADRDATSANALVERFRKDSGKTAVGTIPVHVTVPVIGPSFFVAAELTAESQPATLDIQYKRVSER
jgi:hypothetical protein